MSVLPLLQARISARSHMLSGKRYDTNLPPPLSSSLGRLELLVKVLIKQGCGYYHQTLDQAVQAEGKVIVISVNRSGRTGESP